MNMMSYSQERVETSRSVAPSSQVAVIRRELVELTGDHFSAVILNQLLYWTQRVKDFDLLLEEERTFNSNCNASPCHGWIYKTANELIEETMLCISRFTMRRYLSFLVEQGWVYEKLGPTEKWNKTTHYRLNLRKLQTDLQGLGYHAFEAFGQQIPALNEMQVLSKVQVAPSKEHIALSNVENCSFESAPLHQDHFAPSEEHSAPSVLEPNSSNVQIALSREQIAPSNVENCSFEGAQTNIRESKNEHSNVENCSFIYLNREYTENKNKEHTQDARACEKSFSNLDLKDFCSDHPDTDLSKTAKLESPPSANEDSVAQDMVDFWERHIVQKLFPKKGQGTLTLTDTRKSQLESLFAFHFQNDIRQWERFCLRIKGIPFLMGEGPSGWHVTIDWILCDKNVAKVLEGNYEMSHRIEAEDSEWQGGPIQAPQSRTPEKEVLLESIQDPLWKEWCTRLSQGVRLNELKFLHEPLSVFQLKEIAHARFIECEDERLIWIGSPDPAVLKAIETLHHQISWVYAKEYPNARAMRTRLDSEPHPIPQGDAQHD